MVSVFSYTLVLFFSLGASSLVMMVILLEAMSWLFIFSLESTSEVMKYLLIQSYFITSAITLILWAPSLIFFSMLLKLGLPPFQTWFMHFCAFLSSKSFVFISTLHKFVPLVFLGKSLFFSGGLLFSCVLMSLGTVFLFQSSLFFYMLMFSSMVHSVWMMLGFLVSKLLSSMYWLFYSSVLMTLVISSQFSKTLALASGQGLLSSLVWLIVSGIPPFTFFWLKTNVLIVCVKLSLFLSLLFILSSVLALGVYFWAFHIVMTSSNSYNIFQWYVFPAIFLFSLASSI